MNNQATEFATLWEQKWFGFWADEASLTNAPFSLENHIDVDWNPEDRNLLIDYLKHAPIAIAAQTQKVKCGLCEEKVNSSSYRSDGELLWHDSLAHLIEKHSFVLPHNFVEHIRSMGYVPPASFSIPVQDLPWPK